MNCPRDGYELAANELNGAKLHRCSACGGLWINYNSLKNTVAGDGDTLWASAPAAENNPDETPCPMDASHLLVRKAFFGIEIDSCPEHLGFWFDGGELEALLPKWKEAMAKDEDFTAHCLVELLMGNRDTGGGDGLFEKIRAALWDTRWPVQTMTYWWERTDL
jgi:Zn-finger nucleic acid-binding protein